LLNVRELGVSVKGGVAPFPARFTVCGLLLAPSVTLSVPLRAPVAVGANLTLKVQLLDAARVEPHVLVCVKSPATATALIDTPIVELFVSVTVCAALTLPTTVSLKFNLPGEAARLTTPFPLSDAVCGLFAALSVMVRIPDREPIAVGVNRTSTSHDRPAPRLVAVLHVVVGATLKSPSATMLENVTEECWLLVSRMVCVATAPTVWFPNDRVEGLKLIGGVWL
jgi:hypothetical protein